jgi:uncharacterized membrane protein
MQEHLVKFTDRDVYLGRLGCFGFALAFMQCMALELPGIRSANFTGETIGAIVGFVLCLFFMYANTSVFLQVRGLYFFILFS